MKHNMGMVDRGLRGVVGALLLMFFFIKQPDTPLLFWGSLVLGVLLLGTAALGVCPPYKLFGINTCGLGESPKN